MSVFDLHATTVVGIIHNGEAAIGSDGQATLDKTVMKSTVKKFENYTEEKFWQGSLGLLPMLLPFSNAMKKN